MIFVTVGASTPFDRLVQAVESWAKSRDRHDVFAQIGASANPPHAIEWTRFLDPRVFHKKCEDASLIVAHAGTGTLLAAMELGKPIVVMPREAARHETRNDHQLATVVRFGDRAGVFVAMNEAELVECLDNVISSVDSVDTSVSYCRIGRHATPRLIEEIRQFINAPC